MKLSSILFFCVFIWVTLVSCSNNNIVKPINIKSLNSYRNYSFLYATYNYENKENFPFLAFYLESIDNTNISLYLPMDYKEGNILINLEPGEYRISSLDLLAGDGSLIKNNYFDYVLSIKTNQIIYFGSIVPNILFFNEVWQSRVRFNYGILKILDNFEIDKKLLLTKYIELSNYDFIKSIETGSSITNDHKKIRPIADRYFQVLLKGISYRMFRNENYWELIEDAARDNYFTIAQIERIFDFDPDSSKLTFKRKVLDYMYPKLIDKKMDNIIELLKTWFDLDDKIEILEYLYPSIIDRNNSFKLFSLFKSSYRKKVQNIIDKYK